MGISLGKEWHKVSGVLLLALLSVMTNPASAQTGNATNGQKLFHEKCERCHGKDGSGNTSQGRAFNAADLSSSDVQKKTDADFYRQIEKGKDAMPPFGASLDKNQISDLIAYVRQFGKKSSETKK